MKEFRDRDVVVFQELGHSDIVLIKEMSDCLVKEFCDSDVVLGLGEELSHGNIVVEEFSDGRIQVLSQGGVHELGDGHIV